MAGDDQNVEEGAKSEETGQAFLRLYRDSIAAIDVRRFDVAKLGEDYEGLGLKIPLVATYVEARRKALAALPPDVRRVVATLYHAAMGGARLTAGLSMQAAVLAASNYGAPSPAALAASRALAAAAGPIGLGVAVLSTALTFAAGERTMTPDEARAAAVQLYLRRKQARKILDGLDGAQRMLLIRIGALGYLEDVARLPDDPAAWLQNPRLVRAYRALLVSGGSVRAGLETETSLRARAGRQLEPIRASYAEGLRAVEELDRAGLLPDEPALLGASQEALRRLGVRAALESGKLQIRPRRSEAWWRKWLRAASALVRPRSDR